MITSGQQALASDFISTSAGSASSGQVPKLNGNGKLDPSFLSLKFGGTGALGALTITSGVTTVNLANAQFTILNYSSISITGTGSLAFSNPYSTGSFVSLKSQGAMTLTSSATPMINMSGMGAAGGGVGSNGTKGVWLPNLSVNGGTGTTTFGSSQAGGAGATTNNTGAYIVGSIFNKLLPNFFTGGGGGGTPSSGGGSGKTGGNGGGALYIECGGAWNFTTANGISVAGAPGDPTLTYGSDGGGGGGGGGSCVVLYNSLTANTGTINVSGGTGAQRGNGTGTGGAGGSGQGGTGIGGAGGTGGTGSPVSCGGGGGGGSALNGANGSAGSGSGGTGLAGCGGGGASGWSLILANTEFA